MADKFMIGRKPDDAAAFDAATACAAFLDIVGVADALLWTLVNEHNEGRRMARMARRPGLPLYIRRIIGLGR